MSRRRIVRISAGLILLFVAAAAPALAESQIEKDLQLAPGGRFVLDSDLGSVTVRGSRDSGVHLIITSKRSDIDEYVEFDFREGAGTVEVIGKKIRRFGFLSSLFGGGDGGSLRYEVEVPRETDLDIETGGGRILVEEIEGAVELETSGGSVRVYDVNGELDARTSGGSIDIARIQGNTRVSTSGGSIEADSIDGSLSAKTSGGHVTINDVSGDLVARSSGGSIRIDGAGGRVEASTSGGSVSAQFNSGNSSGGSLSSSGGGIRVSLDPGVGLELDAHTSGGSVTCDLPVTVSGSMSRGTLRGTIGGGGESLRIRTSGGSIRIREN